MKKLNLLAAAGIMAATLGVSATPQTVPSESQSNTRKSNDAVEKPARTVRQGRATALNPTGGMTYLFPSSGRSPKVYGQWLQSNGRQKWNIKNKK